MQDVNLPIRRSFYTRLNGMLTYNGVVAPIGDEVLKSTDENADFYVILSSQFSRPAYTKSSSPREATILLDIVSKTQRVSKQIVDDLASQIINLIFPDTYAPYSHTLPVPAGWQFHEVQIVDDRPGPTSVSDSITVVRRLLQFQLRVIQN